MSRPAGRTATSAWCRAWTDWLSRLPEHLPLHITITSQSPGVLTARIDHPALDLDVSVTDHDITVWVWRSRSDDGPWDVLWSADVSPVETPAGWHCRECGVETAQPTLAELLADHLFEPLAEWMRNIVDVAGVEYVERRGVRWVEMVRQQ